MDKVSKQPDGIGTSRHRPKKAKRKKPSLGHVPLRAADAKRSVENILRWNSYLPTDCVRTMVRMGWDYTT